MRLAALLFLAACGGSRAAAPSHVDSAASGAAPADAVIPPDVITFQQDLAWSPDGKRLAFSLRTIPRARWEAVEYDALEGTQFDVYIVNADGTGLHQVTNDEFDELWVSWLPDGEQVAFASTRAGESAIYVIGVEDGDPEAKQVTNSVPKTADAAWSPSDARMLAYSGQVDAHQHIYTTTILSQVPRQMTREPFEHRGPVWSPDGKRLVFNGNPRGPGKEDIFVVSVEDAVVTTVTDDDANDFYPGWMPDGRVTFTTTDARGARQIVARPVERDQRVVLVDGAFFGRVSPDGASIAYIAGDFPDSAIYVRPIDPAAKAVKIVE